MKSKELSMSLVYIYISIICIFILVAAVQTARLNDEIELLKTQVEKSKPVVDWYYSNFETLKENK